MIMYIHVIIFRQRQHAPVTHTLAVGREKVVLFFTGGALMCSVNVCARMRNRL